MHYAGSTACTRIDPKLSARAAWSGRFWGSWWCFWGWPEPRSTFMEHPRAAERALVASLVLGQVDPAELSGRLRSAEFGPVRHGA